MIQSRPASAADAHPTLTLRGIGKSFGGVNAVVDASFSVLPGTITGLIGPNGAGKSTTLSIVSGEIEPSTGTVHFLGQDVTGSRMHELARRGLVRTFQHSSEFPRMTVMENLLVAASPVRRDALWTALIGPRRWAAAQDQDVARARALMDRFELHNENEYAGNLSGGQKRLLELMRALMAQPKALLLDEPMAGVNPSLARQVEEHLLELRSDGLTMLMVEHELATVERLCSVVITMANGRVIAEGSMAEVRTNQDVLDAYLIG